MPYESYPNDFRIPEWSPYSLEVDMGVRRTPMESGFKRQRRQYKTMPTMINLTFVLTWKQLRNWQLWWNEFAYDWFEMPAISAFSTGDAPCDPHIMRCISDLSISVSNVRGYCRVDCVIELGEQESANAPDVLYGWIIAGEPDNPSPDWYRAGPPGNPAPDWIDPGSPENPSPTA